MAQDGPTPAEVDSLAGCAICGYPLTDRHHIVPKKYGGLDIDDNLISLCPNHHRAIHMLIAFSLHNARHGKQVSLPRGWTLETLDALWSVCENDPRLLEIFSSTFWPKFATAGYPIEVPIMRRIERRRIARERLVALYQRSAVGAPRLPSHEEAASFGWRIRWMESFGVLGEAMRLFQLHGTPQNRAAVSSAVTGLFKATTAMTQAITPDQAAEWFIDEEQQLLAWQMRLGDALLAKHGTRSE